MIPRLLSIAGPLSVYASLAVLIYGLWKARQKFDWLALVPAVASLAASIIFLPAIHRLFFDEDIYINIANNLAHAPVNQVTVMGGPDEIEVSSYYKEPPGWPVLLSLVFLITGRSESVAFWVARILFALAVAAVFHLSCEMIKSRRQAIIAAILFGATPICLWFSVSAGTDIPAALLAILGMWGLVTGNGPLACAGIALAAQTRMELLILVPLVWLLSKIPFKWKATTAGLVAVEIAHVFWVMSVAPVLAQAERVPAAFSPRYVVMNLRSNLAYLFNPYEFFGLTLALAFGIAIYGGWRAARDHHRLIYLPALGLLCIYLFFYAGSFEMNPRYSIQVLAPIAVLSASFMEGRRAILLFAIVLPYTHPYELPGYAQALAADHRMSAEIAAQLSPNDLIVSAQPEMFINQGRRAMNVLFALDHKEKLEEEFGRRKIWYHSGVRTNASDTQDALADGWVKSNFELHLIQLQEASGMRVAFYELLKDIHREAGLRRPFEGESNGGKRR